jgi:hypothetical protein
MQLILAILFIVNLTIFDILTLQPIIFFFANFHKAIKLKHEKTQHSIYVKPEML